MTIEPTNPVATPAVTVAALLADLALLDRSMEPEEGEPVYPVPYEYETILATSDEHVALLARRQPTTSGEALAMLVLAYGQLRQWEGSTLQPEGEPRWLRSTEWTLRLIEAAMPLIAAAVPSLTPVERAVVDLQAGHVLR